jgi:hypothetical protein
MNRPSWHYSAPCATTDGDEWFPEVGGDGARAKEICSACPYKAPCLLDAIHRREQHGIWGGVNFRRFPTVRRELGIELPARRDAAPCGPDHARGANRYVDPEGRSKCRACNANHSALHQARKRVAS